VRSQLSQVGLNLSESGDRTVTVFVRPLPECGKGRIAAKGKPGRPETMLDVAQYVNKCRLGGLTWTQVTDACVRQWPDRVKSTDQLRQLHQRFSKKTRRT
jgi:hypothetical protein